MTNLITHNKVNYSMWRTATCCKCGSPPGSHLHLHQIQTSKKSEQSGITSLMHVDCSSSLKAFADAVNPFYLQEYPILQNNNSPIRNREGDIDSLSMSWGLGIKFSAQLMTTLT